jgi:hypothetical protein
LESLTKESIVINVDHYWAEGIDIEETDDRYKIDLGDFQRFSIVIFYLSSFENDYCAYIMQNGDLFGCTKDQYNCSLINPYDYPEIFKTQLILGKITEITQINQVLSDIELKNLQRFTYHSSDNRYTAV